MSELQSKGNAGGQWLTRQPCSPSEDAAGGCGPFTTAPVDDGTQRVVTLRMSNVDHYHLRRQAWVRGLSMNQWAVALLRGEGAAYPVIPTEEREHDRSQDSAEGA